jgi:hypothetical protein
MLTRMTAALIMAALLLTAGIGGFAFAQPADDVIEVQSASPDGIAEVGKSSTVSESSDSGETPRQPSNDESVVVLYLEHASADSIAPILKQLFPEVRIAADQRANALLARGAEPAELDAIEATAAKLDELFREHGGEERGSAAATTGASRSSARNPFGAGQSARRSVGNLKHANCALCHSEPGKNAGTLAGLDRAEYQRLQRALGCSAVVDDLGSMLLGEDMGGGMAGSMMGYGQPAPAIDARQRYALLEQAAAKLAARPRQADTYGTSDMGGGMGYGMPGTVMGDAETSTKERQQIRRLVAAAFEARQAMQREEVEQFRLRLTRIEQSIAAREALRDKIIDRRVQELLNPELRWEPADVDPAKPPGPRFLPPAPDGEVLSIDQEKQLVEISLGADHGIRRGNTLSVTRDRHNALLHVGHLIVMQVTADRAVARIEKQSDPIRVGDRVALSEYRPAPSTPRRGDEAGAVRPPQTSGAVLSIDGIQYNLRVAGGAAPQTSGMVLSVDDEKKLVEISLGIRDRMETGLRLSVVRDNEYLGRLAVIRTRDNSATARIEKENVEMPIRPGDRIRPERKSEPARRQSADNLKALMIGLHRYYAHHDRFPPAVIERTFDGKTVPHSWRVAILPFLGERALYDQYKFDEPWDSQHNRTLLEKMPAVFRSPLDAADSTNASYFALVTPGYPPPAAGAVLDGAGAMDEYDLGLGEEGGLGPRRTPAGFGGIRPGRRPARQPSYRLGTFFSNPAGTQMRNITDGTSYTIALVEARRNIPWTRPHDIPYFPASDQPLPVLGGWFSEGWHAGFADGSAKFLSYDNDEATLRALFTIGGGEPVTPKLVDEMAIGRDDAEIDSSDQQPGASHGPTDDESEQSSDRGIKLPADQAGVAVVWIEAVLDEPQPDGRVQATTVYMNGTIVSPDGLIAVAVSPELEPTKRLKSAIVNLPNEQVVAGRLIAYDAEFGVGLLKVDTQELPYLPLSAEPIAANRRLALHAKGVWGIHEQSSFGGEIRVEQLNYRVNDTDGFFTLSRNFAHAITREQAGAALVTRNSHLDGILGWNLASLKAPVIKEAVWAVPANVIQRLLDQVKTPQKDAKDDLPPLDAIDEPSSR